MKRFGFVPQTLLLALALTSGLPFIAAQQQDASLPGVPVQMVVTVEARHGNELPVINREDVMVYEGRDRDQVTNWIPLKDSAAGTELFVLIDDAANSTQVGSQLQDIRNFINAQPANVAIGVGYMRNGTVAIAQNPARDHAQAAKALRLPLGDPGASASPYFSLVDLIKRWPKANAARAVLMISDGIDRFYGSGPDDPYVDQAISRAQEAGIIVFSIYSPGVGHFGHSLWRMNWGQNYLSQTSDETGGESFYIGFGPAVSFSPFLDDLAQHLSRQYLLTFVAKPENKAGLRQVKLRTEVPNADLVSADRVYVPAGK
jgi:hypothetical protein